MAKPVVVVILVILGVVIVAGIAVGVYAGVKGFDSDDSSDDDDDDDNETTTNNESTTTDSSSDSGGTTTDSSSSSDSSSSNDSSSSSSSDDSSSSSSSNVCSRCYEPDCSGSLSGSCSTPSVSITGTGGGSFSMSGNAYPCHEMPGGSTYVVCPTTVNENYSFANPNLCSDGQYADGSSCRSFSYSSTQPAFGDAGVLGRPATKSAHWSSSNLPKELVPYDPLPAECGDETAHQCNSSYSGDKRFSVIDIQRLNDAGGRITYDDGDTVNVSIDSFNAHVQPQGSTNPSSATAGLYHYHGPPSWDNGSFADYVIGYALDGVPFMGRGTKLTSGSTGTSSYNLRSGRTGEYHMDYEYVSGSGTLDEFNGGTVTIGGVSTYAYVATSDYPYLFRNFHGKQ